MHVRTVCRTALAALAGTALAITAACSASTGADIRTDSAAAGNVQGAVQPVAFTTDTPGSTQAAQRTIMVTATGTATGTPDTLTVQLGVQTQAKTAGAALSDNNTKAQKLIASLHSQGVDKKDITTSDLSIYPTYNDSGNTITGYQVSNTVSATLRHVDKAGAVIDAAARAVGDAIRLNQVGFSFDDDSSLRATARANAVKQAMTQAKQLADAAGVAIGGVVSITEGGNDSGPQPFYPQAMADSAASGASMPVVAGEGQLAITVQVVVSIG